MRSMAGETDIDDDEEETEVPGRAGDLLGRPNSKLRQEVTKLFDKIRKGFDDQIERADGQSDWWDCYNCKLNRRQGYNGNADIYVPLIRDAINALVTRDSNQLFPSSGKYVEAVSSDGKQPFDIIALIDHYVRTARLKTQVVKPLIRHGLIEGQYNLYLDWEESRRWIVSRETHPPIDEETGVEAPGEDIEDIEEDEQDLAGPCFEVLHDSDVLWLPATANSIDEAFARGGLVAIVRRWSETKIDEMIENGEILKREGEDLKKMMQQVSSNLWTNFGSSIEKKLNEDVGVRAGGKEASVWEVWKALPLNDKGRYDEDSGTKKLCKLWLGPNDLALGCKRNPNWNDRCNLLSWPVEKIGGQGKGKSQVQAVAPLQYEANDAANKGSDSSSFSLLPIVARDPVNGTAPLIMNLAAVWNVAPNDVKFLEFPDLTPRSLAIIQYCMTAINASLSVTPAMLPQSTGRPGAKRNQAEIALEQQVELLGVAERTSVLEEGVLNDTAAWLIDLDHQFRDKAKIVRSFGELGHQATLLEIPPQQNRKRYFFQWIGAQQAQQNVAMMQQGTGFINVLKGMRAELAAEGYELRLGPLLEKSAINIFGAATGRLILQDIRHQLSMDPELENELMGEGHEVAVHPMDMHPKHIQSHQKWIIETGDPAGIGKAHVAMHIAAMKAQAAMMMMQQAGQVAPQQQQQGGAGGPQPGAIPAGPRLIKGPPGQVRPDNMPGAGALTMPRRA